MRSSGCIRRRFAAPICTSTTAPFPGFCPERSSATNMWAWWRKRVPRSAVLEGRPRRGGFSRGLRHLSHVPARSISPVFKRRSARLRGRLRQSAGAQAEYARIPYADETLRLGPGGTDRRTGHLFRGYPDDSLRSGGEQRAQTGRDGGGDRLRTRRDHGGAERPGPGSLAGFRRRSAEGGGRLWPKNWAPCRCRRGK